MSDLNYLEQHLEPLDQRMVEGSKILFERMTGQEFTNKGTLLFNVAEVSFLVEYSDFKGVGVDVLDYMARVGTANYRELDEMEIKAGKDKLIFPFKGTRVLFNVKRSNQATVLFPNRNILVLNDLITTPIGIANMSHDYGHYFDPMQRENAEGVQRVTQKVKSGESSIDETEAALFLRCERNAWAWAFKTLKPLMNALPDKFNKNLLVDYAAHTRSLRGYSANIRGLLSEEMHV